MPTPPQTNGRDQHERLLLYGGPDAGKTHTILTIAKWHQDLDSDAVFYVIATDMSYERMLGPGADFESVKNVEYEYAMDMQDYMDLGRKWNKKVRSHDFLCVDLLHDAWAAAGDEYSRARYGKDLAERWATEGSPDEYPVTGWEWGMPNARYRTFIQNYIMRCRGHVVCVSGEATLQKESKSGKMQGESEEMEALFGPIGVKPMGQKADPFRFHDILHLDRWRGNPAIATARAKQRERLGKSHQGGQVTPVPIEDFFVEYLMKVGGWKP